MTDQTTHYGLKLPDFNIAPWHDEVNNNARTIDALIFESLQAAGITGVWDFDTLYTVGERVVDPDTSTIFTCLVSNISPASGTFADYRSSNPSHWIASTLALTPRGEWANETVYNQYDIVYDQGEGIAALCLVAHTSSASPDTIRDDAAFWEFIIDLQLTANADDVAYDNATSGLTAADVQAAIDEMVVNHNAALVSIALKANIASPALTGTPTAPTPSTGDETTRLATTAHVAAKIAASSGLSNVAVRVASTANVVIATALEEGDTIDGVVLVAADLVLLKNQTTAAENGFYDVPASGAASRNTAFDTWDELVGKVANVSEGTANADTSWRFTINPGGTINVTAVTVAAYGGGGLQSPVGIPDGGTGETDAAAAFAALKQAATEGATGVAERATTGEAAAGTDTERYVTPAGAAAAIAALGISAGTIVGVQRFTASGTYTRAAGCTKVLAIGQAAGGGGGGVDNVSSGFSSGGSGAAGETRIGVFTPAATVAVTIGAPGTGGPGDNDDGGTGSDLTFGAHMVCKGGIGGQGVTSDTTHGASGTTPTGSGGVVIPPTKQPVTSAVGVIITGGCTLFGIGGLKPSSGDGEDGDGYGSGGAGARTNSGEEGGGDGAPGILFIIEYK